VRRDGSIRGRNQSREDQAALAALGKRLTVEVEDAA